MKNIAIKNSKSISIIDNTFMVTNRTGYRTNLDISVKQKGIDLPDGIYSLKNELTPEFNLDEFPLYMPKKTLRFSFIPEFDIIKVLTECAKYTDPKEELRPFIKHVNINCKSGIVDIVGTNANILICKTFKTHLGQDFDISIPVEGIKTLASIKEKLTLINVFDGYIEFCFIDISVSMRLDVNTYPDYRAVIPFEMSFSSTFDHKELEPIIKQYDIEYKADKKKDKTYRVKYHDMCFNARYLSLLLPDIPLLLNAPNRAAMQKTDDTLILLIPVSYEEIEHTIKTNVKPLNNEK